MSILQSGPLTVRPLNENDAVLLVRWLSDSRVLQYYEGRDRPHDMALVQEHFYEYVEDEGVTRCIIEYDGQAVGYIQFYLVVEEEREEYGYDGFNGSVYGMDQFIGEVGCWNKGIGTRLINEMVRYLIRERKADAIVMDPQAWNERAIHVYEKCGFVKKKLLPKHEWHEGEKRDCWLMEHKGLAET